MTVTYISSGVFKSLFIWRGGIIKATIWHALSYFAAFYAIMAINHFVLGRDLQVRFAKLCVQFEKGTGHIPITLLLGFFVAAVVAKWWAQFNWISWPDKFMTHVMVYMPGKALRPYRQLISRWSSLQAAVAWRMRSSRSKRRFPTLKHLVSTGLMTDEEYEIFEKCEDRGYGKWWLPTLWTVRLLHEMFVNGKVDSVQLKRLFNTACSYRDGFAMLQVYDWMRLPLAYVQVATIATYGYFLLCLIGRQPSAVETHQFVFYIPFFTLFEFAFYIGWLQVGQQYADPFGDDDDDFEMNWILDRNVSTADLMAETGVGFEMDIDADVLSDVDEVQRKTWLPHTRASRRIKDIAPVDRLSSLRLLKEDMLFINQDN